MEFTPNLIEYKKITEVLDYYFESIKTGFSEFCKKHFISEPFLCGNLEGNFYKFSIDEFYNTIEKAGNLGAKYKYHYDILALDGNICCVKVIENTVGGTKFNSFFNLVKIDNTWKIVSRVFNSYSLE
jgi:hypothetical protein